MKSLQQHIEERLIINKDFEPTKNALKILNALSKIIDKRTINCIEHKNNIYSYSCGNDTYKNLVKFIYEYGEEDWTACQFEKIGVGEYEYRCEPRYSDKCLVILKEQTADDKKEELTIISENKFIRYINDSQNCLHIYYDYINNRHLYIYNKNYNLKYFVFDVDLVDEIDYLLK